MKRLVHGADKEFNRIYVWLPLPDAAEIERAACLIKESLGGRTRADRSSRVREDYLGHRLHLKLQSVRPQREHRVQRGSGTVAAQIAETFIGELWSAPAGSFSAAAVGLSREG